MTALQSLTTQIDQSVPNTIKSFSTNLTSYHPLEPIQIPLNSQFIQQQFIMTNFAYPQYHQDQPMYFVSIMNQPFQYNSNSDLNNAHQTNNYIANAEASPSQQENKPLPMYNNINNNNIHIEGPQNIKEDFNPDIPKVNTRKIITKARRNRRYVPKLPKIAEKVLKNWVMENYFDPYPMPSEKLILARECGINVNKINYWFKKARKRQADIPCRFSIEIERALRNNLR